MPQRLLQFSLALLVFVPSVLLLDGRGLTRQLALCAATALFLGLFVRRLEIDVRAVLAAIAVATVGECILSIAWGLYEYREAVLPLYVPPGHGLFYALAAAAARTPAFVRRERSIVRGVLVSGSTIAVASLFFANDVWGLIWWIAALALMLRSDHRLLLAACFVNATLLEWAGTYLGNWRWAPVVPGLGVTTANPPSGVGLLYVLLDLIVVALVARLTSARESAAPAVTSSEAV